MKGLLIKDLLCLRKQLLFLGVFMALYLFFLLQLGDSSFLGAYIVMLCVVVTISTFACDEMSKWNAYALSLPVTRRRIVLSRYALSVLLLLAAFILSAVLLLVKGMLNAEQLLTLAGVSAAALALLALFLPLIYKFGTQKSRLVILLVFLVPTGAAFMFRNLFPDIRLPQLDVVGVTSLVLSALLCSVLLLALSYEISYRIFSRKEF